MPNLPIKFHQNLLSSLGGFGLTRNVERWMEIQTDRQGDSYIPPPNSVYRGIKNTKKRNVYMILLNLPLGLHSNDTTNLSLHVDL